MAFGNAFGGFAQGMSMARQDNRRDDEEKRRKEDHERRKQEFARQDAVRREAGNALSNIGQQREDGSVYDEDTAYADAARLTAPHDYTASEGLRTAGLQRKTARVQAKGLERQERYQQNEEDTMAFLQRTQALPDDQYYREVARFATRYGNDGKSFGVEFDHNAGYKLTMVNDGAVRSVPVQNRQQVERLLMSYASPKMRQQSEELGLKERQVGAAETQARAAETNAASMEAWRRNQAGLVNAQSKAWLALANQRETTGAKMPEGEKILLQSRERQQQALLTMLGKAETPEQGAQIQQQLMALQRDEYDHLKKLKLLPDGVTKTQYLRLPDPLQVARQAMSSARTEQEFRASMEQFEQLYGDAPEAAQAFNAMQVFLQNQFYNKVRPQTQSPGLRVDGTRSPLVPAGQYYPGQGSFAAGLVAPPR
jgi:hypothetical protein